MNGKIRYCGLIFIIYMFVFQFGLMQVSPIFNYWDECYALCSIPLYFVVERKISLKESIYKKLIFLLITFIVVGIFSNILYKHQVFKGVVTDVLLQLKFFLGIATTYYLFRNFNLRKCRKCLKKHIKVILLLLFFLTVINKIAKVFPTGNVRFGIDSEMLFFGHPTGMASVSFFLILLLMLLYKRKSHDKFYVAIGGILVISTLRFKAIATTLLFFYIFFIVIITNKKLKGWKIIPFSPIAFLAGWEEFYGYFFSANTMDYARGALFHTGLRIVRDYFPLGAGFGTFASNPSGVYYSPLYSKYGIERVWGLEKDNPFLVTDSFWPMIMGQTGFIGTVIYAMIIMCLFKLIKPAYRIDKGLYLAGVGTLIYLIVSSIAESAFVNPLALPLAMILGLIVSRIKQEEKRIPVI